MAIEIQISDFREHGVRLISPEDPEFEALARPQIGAEADIVLAKMMPCLAAVSNESGRAIVGLNTLWLTEPAGQASRMYSYLRYPDGVFRAGIGRERAIEPGGVHVMSRNAVVVGWPGWSNYVLDEFQREIQRDLHGATKLRIELAVVIFDDGLVLGEEAGRPPEWPGFIDHFRASVDVRREWYTRALQDLEAGRTDEEVLAPAEALWAEMRKPQAHEQMMDPRRAPACDAAGDIRRLIERGREAAIDCLRLAVSRPQFELRRG